MEKILIIEDEILIQESIVDYLQIEGYECISANDGIQGIKKAKDDLPDLIVCDIKMPGLNGHQVLQDLRDDPKTSTIPFIFLSGMVDKGDLRRGMILGADDYITKPFQPEDLLNSVKTRLEKHSVLKERMDVLRDNIAYSLPHELQTPLVSVMGYAEMLVEKFNDNSDEEALEFSSAILQAGMRLNKLIKKLIIYQQLESINLESKTKNLNRGITKVDPGLLNKITNKVAEEFKRKDDLQINIQDASVNIPITYFTLLIEELLDNAFKFSEPGAKVTLNAEKDEEYFELKVIDKGRGMTEEQIANIGAYFQFVRNKYVQQGTGLGLDLSIKITKIYGGDFKINSTRGKQTEAIVRLPLAEN